MNLYTTFFGYMKWHYGRALFTTFSFWRNIITFLFNYFSIKDLSLNFFTPFKRIMNVHLGQVNIVKYVYTFLLTVLGSIIEVVVRLVLLVLGLSVCLVFIAFLPVSLLIWLLLPIFIAFLLVSGLILMIFS